MIEAQTQESDYLDSDLGSDPYQQCALVFPSGKWGDNNGTFVVRWF